MNVNFKLLFFITAGPITKLFAWGRADELGGERESARARERARERERERERERKRQRESE